ncbi:hypothetical protein [Butyrivibrio sp. INlla16]|uniref:hypothetical protein n=1 Tax=Butyrivibrio sp. INlla16 TaxID=1520807 RepID=UPI000892084A|nr:hypothetical protein [Butyrivibrio sp. INlla16]SDB13452.1 hypothetical protein SAMN02910263_00615 [Butyrivibrio sp. INlla16]
MVIDVTRESVCNGDDDQKYNSLEYQEGEMLSSFLRYKVADYLPYSRDGVTIWVIFAGSNENQPIAEREDPDKKVAFIHKAENRCSKVEIRGGDRLVKSLGIDEMFCAVYR